MIIALSGSGAAAAEAPVVAIHVDAQHVIQTIRPIRTFGTSVDSDPKGKIALLYSPSRVDLMLSTGLGMLTYRLYTELSIQDWHWNPVGSYSDAAHRQGYWTSSARTGPALITDSFGYRLPHRGSSRDQGDDDGYSRIDDGNARTYWKSNPYLTHAHTGRPDAENPQWAVIQFLAPQSIDAIRIAWANPYATRYRVEYWTGTADAILHPETATWRTFERGTVEHGDGAATVMRLGTTPVTTSFVRVLMSASSDTCDSHGAQDPRDCMGYAIQDIGVGRVDTRGIFHDLVVRTTDGSCNGRTVCQPDPHRQTLIWTSSDDPWHTDADKVSGDQDQTGLDLIARSRLTRHLPTIYPVSLFYSTPANAANEIRYLEARGYPISYVEMGEEVDGQYALPEDYGALYIQFADAIHAVDPHAKLGGPVFEGVDKDVPVWRDARGDVSWLHRFLGYLQARGHLRDLAFMSYEHYPYHNCDSGATLRNDILGEPAFVRSIAQTWRRDGLPKDVPLLETEDNFSADGTGASQRIYGALWTADFMASSLAAGISYATYYQGEPEPLGHNGRCNTWGAYNPYIVDDNFNVRAKGAAYYALRLLTQQWALPGDGAHGVYSVETDLGDVKPLVTAYALHRPDGLWSVLVVNKDSVARRVTVDFKTGGDIQRFAGRVNVVTFGREQYRWTGRGPADVPNPDRGLVHSIAAGEAASYFVPPESLTVIRGVTKPVS
ncbi:MAG TPA: discoidin domain-containing protein [Candidatus Eremiobacteraceae bacterium]|nr:discoidin domain-containing protein [Candidatus Eremiobacteraceae bacterium]